MWKEPIQGVRAGFFFEIVPMRPSDQSKSKPNDSSSHSDKFTDPIEETGCQAQNDAVLLCFSETHDWRKCQPEVEAFRKCYQEYTEKRRDETVAKIRTTIGEILDETLVEVDKELAEKMGADTKLRPEDDRPSRLRMSAQFNASPNSDHLPIFASSFAKRNGNIFACSDEEGNVSITDIKNGSTLSHVRHPDSIFDVQFSADDSRILLASADEFTYIRDTGNLEGNPLMCLGYHQGTVRSARWRPNDRNVLVTAARDGSAAMWDLRMTSASPSHSVPVNVFADIHKKPCTAGGRKSGVASEKSNLVQAEFMPLQDHLIATIGQPDHCVKVWDTRYKWGANSTPVPVDQIRAPILPGSRERAFTSFVFDSTGSSMFCVNANNNIYQFCLANCSSTPLRQLNAPQYEAGSFFVRLDLSPCGRYLASGSVQDNTFIWDLQSRKNKCYRVGGHYREVTSVSWSQDEYGDLMLLSCGEDGSVNLWSESPEATEMLGFGRPTLINTDEWGQNNEELACSYDLASELDELENLPLRSDFIVDLENIRPSTPPNLLIPSSLQTTCKKSVISDYFRPVQQGISVTEQLLLSHRSSPATKREPEESTTSGALKRLSGILNFCSSPVRPCSKLARSGRHGR